MDARLIAQKALAALEQTKYVEKVCQNKAGERSNGINFVRSLYR